MKTFFKIILVVLTFAVLGTLYFFRYTTFKAGSDEILFYNPFTIDEVGFRDNYETAVGYLKKGDSLTAKKYFEKAIKYRGTHNEQVRESIYSCGNGLWEYKQDKLLKFSHCYENLGMLDSAMTCLEPALYNFERYHFQTEDQFFRLAIEKYGKAEVINELRSALTHIQEIDCFMCLDYYFEFKGIKVGLDMNDMETVENEIFEKLKKKYCG